MKKVLLAALTLLLMTAGMAAAEETWLEIGGDYRYRYDSLKGEVQGFTDSGMLTGNTPGTGIPGFTVKNESLMTNRFGINLKATPVEDVTVKARLLMYKVFGHQTSFPVNGAFFGDRAMGPFDGTVAHVPSDNTVRVDYAYATVSNVFNMPAWVSVGRRPSTGGAPGNLRQNKEKMGTAGIPNMLVDYAFDGATVGVAPDIEALPGFYGKLCYGKGFDSGYKAPGMMNEGLSDTTFTGINFALIDTENLHAEVQWQKGWNIFDSLPDPLFNPFAAAYTPATTVGANMGDIEWAGGVVMGKIGSLNLFVSGATSKTDPTDTRYGGGVGFSGPTTMPGLLYDIQPESHTGSAYYVGGRFDIAKTGTKIGAEYNHGSKYWLGFVPAGDDMWTSKLGTRGDVYEVYVIQSLNRKPVSKRGDAFVRLGYQVYNFNYTGSNFWVGEPKKIDSLYAGDPNPLNMQMLFPLRKATDVYLTFDVVF